ncbi:glycosyltransferase family 2 protein [Pseudobutyrivibrio sp.]|uniref:glycosyltransferase family 2 protein n=1 Tax=Pseudobutyrivibrio sp. TaxID=2014367 RepID=UPI001D89F17D|nr:glycosyltransferase family 2 protein [Pseudobutyrivibrio sp.]MBE5912317.1 glycosyltransferase family 2 protein [Pseudobutyrivibrio sp.]
MKKTVVLLATYNGQQYLRQQLDSIFNQTFQDFYLVIHDDGSTDGTLDIIKEYYEQHHDRVEIIYGQRCGSAKANFLYLMTQVEADYYFLCDQDDVWLSDKMEKSMAKMISTIDGDEKTPVAVFSDMTVVDNELNNMSDSFINYIGRSPRNIAYTQILIDNPAAGTTMCINRALRDIAVSKKSINWDHIPMHDAWLMELAAIFGKVGYVDSALVYYRQTGHNTMGASTESTIDKIGRNLDTANKGFLAKKRDFINEARYFAREVLKLEDIPEDKLKVLSDFVNIGTKPKLHRIRFYRENNFTRAHHNLWMRLWV